MIKNLLDSDENEGERVESAKSDSSFSSLLDADEQHPKQFVTARFEPETSAETVRRSGMAYSAAIALFASVAFMLIVGWGADLLLGSSPWGIVGGIVLGALIGFVQFFRITSQIFKK